MDIWQLFMDIWQLFMKMYNCLWIFWPQTQHELEAKMHQLLTQIVELQQKTGITEGERKMAGSESRILELERQVAELNERRFEHLENMQQQQMQLQVSALF